MSTTSQTVSVKASISFQTSEVEELQKELKSIAPEDYQAKNYSSVTDIVQIKKLIREICGNDLKKRLNSCSPGQKDWKNFQDICLDLVKLTLEQNEFKDAKTSSELPTSFVPLDSKGIRKDIVIPLVPKRLEKNEDIATIWDQFRYKPWHCRYLVFDAKNYSGYIKDKEIYQMFHYLNKKNGKIGVIFSRKYSVDKSGKAVLRRIRDENYIVFILTDKKIVDWINCYIERGHVRSFFQDVLTEYDHSFASE